MLNPLVSRLNSISSLLINPGSNFASQYLRYGLLVAWLIFAKNKQRRSASLSRGDKLGALIHTNGNKQDGNLVCELVGHASAWMKPH